MQFLFLITKHLQFFVPLQNVMNIFRTPKIIPKIFDTPTYYTPPCHPGLKMTGP